MITNETSYRKWIGCAEQRFSVNCPVHPPSQLNLPKTRFCRNVITFLRSSKQPATSSSNPLKPTQGLNGPPNLRCRYREWSAGAARIHGKCLSSKSSVSARTRAPFAQSKGSAHSSGAWLRPSRQGTKIMPMGAMGATNTPSWPAPLGSRVLKNPAAVDAFSIAS